MIFQMVVFSVIQRELASGLQRPNKRDPLFLSRISIGWRVGRMLLFDSSRLDWIKAGSKIRRRAGMISCGRIPAGGGDKAFTKKQVL